MSKKNNQKTKILIVLSVVLAAAAIFLGFQVQSKQQPSALDEFAQCLTNQNAVLYGAYWCSSCKKQEEMFGQSWRYIDYIECATPGIRSQVKICQNTNIEGYPTWIFEDDKRVTGVQTFGQLAAETNCPLPANL